MQNFPISFKQRFDGVLASVQRTSVINELDRAITEYTVIFEQYEETDDDNWLEQLKYHRANSDRIQQHIAAAAADSVTFDEDTLNNFFAALTEQLTATAIENSNVAIIRYGEHEKLHLDLLRREQSEALFKDVPYAQGVYINGKIISDHNERLGETDIKAARLYNHPLDESELFVSIADEYFDNVMYLRRLRLEQQLLQKITTFLQDHYPMINHRFFIGGYGECLFVE